jgi:hypothetical protein
MMELHYDEWIMNHTDESRVIKPYQESIYTLRHKYNDIFPEYRSIEEMKKQGKEIDRVFKIRYTVNLLPSVGEYVYMVQHQKLTGRFEKRFMNKDHSLTDMLS